MLVQRPDWGRVPAKLTRIVCDQNLPPAEKGTIGNLFHEGGKTRTTGEGGAKILLPSYTHGGKQNRKKQYRPTLQLKSQKKQLIWT